MDAGEVGHEGITQQATAHAATGACASINAETRPIPPSGFQRNVTPASTEAYPSLRPSCPALEVCRNGTMPRTPCEPAEVANG